MQKHRKLTEGRVSKFVTTLWQAIYTDHTPLTAKVVTSPEPMPLAKARKARYKAIKVGQEWGKGFDCAWFKITGKVPAHFADKEVVALIGLGGEGCVFNAKGEPIQGLNCGPVDPRRCNTSGKQRVNLFAKARAGQAVDLFIEGGANQLWGAQNSATLKQAELVVFRRDIWDLYFDFTFCQKLMDDLDPRSRRAKLLLYALNDVVNHFGDGSPTNVRRCRKLLTPELAKPANASTVEVSAIGHAHIDVAWLWPLRETIRKTGRTFSTALAMIAEYPGYRFGASQPHLYQMIKDAYPALYERIKRAVKAGKWELQGAMWVESDTNVTGGESLIRQLLHGKRFWRDEFGQDVRNLWLPDVFGYSAALPQILRKSGVDAFMTQKLSWSQFNEFPHHTMTWRGLDGSEIFTHFLANNNYNCDGGPVSLRKLELDNKDADRAPHALCLFGIGDGGGGPGRPHIEGISRAADLEDLPRVKMEFAETFFAKAREGAHDLLTWDGELYLEYHRGTYTTQALTKKYNRKLELKLREAEALYALLNPADYPDEAFDRLWKVLLLNQFHDVLPGSSITRVYAETNEQFRQTDVELDDLLNAGEQTYARKVHTAELTKPIIIRNSLNWERIEPVRVPGDLSGKVLLDPNGDPVPAQAITDADGIATLLDVVAPPMGHTTVSQGTGKPRLRPSPLRVSKRLLENEMLEVRFGPDGSITSIHDKTAGRQVLAQGETGNRFRLFEDKPVAFDAWDIDAFYEEIPPTAPKLVSSRVTERGPIRVTIEQVYKAENYDITQSVRLLAGAKRIEFDTTVDWRESENMLRVEFPVAIRAREATYDIQFGNLTRPTHANTSWDMARFEVVAHKWADISQPNYGVAILNDCKYGHRIRDNVISLTLLRSPTHPDPEADRHVHRFCYALAPHEGDHIAGDVARHAYEFNIPLRAVAAKASRGAAPAVAPGLTTDAENVIIEAVKKAEETDDIIVRLYESAGCDVVANLQLPFAVKAAAEVDMMEQNPEALTVRDGKLRLPFKPFEIRTVRLTRA